MRNHSGIKIRDESILVWPIEALEGGSPPNSLYIRPPRGRIVKKPLPILLPAQET